jgi:hypothetical protein
MFLILTMFAFFGWGSMTAGPGYGAARVIVTFIAAITSYLLFWSDLRRISHKLFSRTKEQAQQVTSATHESGLPPAQMTPVPAHVSRRINTAEMVQPPSITEQTTNLLVKRK